MTMVIIYIFLNAGNDISEAFSPDDQYGIYYRHGRVFGKIIHYDPERDLVIVFGSVFVKETDSGWRRVESRKFHLVNPVGSDVREVLSAAIGRTASIEGELLVWPGQKEEVLAARSVEFQETQIETPPWYAFGKTIRPERIYKFNLNTVSDFVKVLAGLQKAADIPQNVRLTGDEISSLSSKLKNSTPEDRELINQVRSELEKSWNEKWCVTKDNKISDELRSGVGGWQFYQGFLGYGNSYISSAPVIRKDITAFMNAVREGGGTPEMSGPALMCAYVTVSRDRYGITVRVMSSGALYDSVPGLLEAMKNPASLNLETWRLEGWDQKKAMVMEGKLCWLSGSRVLAYKTDPKTGRSYLADQYFAMDKYLTRDGFENVLDVGNSLIGEGGF